MGVHDDDATATLQGWLDRSEDENRRLRAEVERLRGEVVNRNRRALDGDKAVEALENVHAYYEGLEAEVERLREEAGKKQASLDAGREAFVALSLRAAQAEAERDEARGDAESWERMFGEAEGWRKRVMAERDEAVSLLKRLTICASRGDLDALWSAEGDTRDFLAALRGEEANDDA